VELLWDLYKPQVPTPLDERTKMDRFYHCINCQRRFKVTVVTQQDSPEVSHTLSCPYCEVRNDITLPDGCKYVTGPTE
jgi:DNA-directed RNA polymerase subunit RPC12/RpoP